MEDLKDPQMEVTKVKSQGGGGGGGGGEKEQRGTQSASIQVLLPRDGEEVKEKILVCR